VNLETGRTHQIRVHFSAFKHPLLGDTMYGADPKLAKSLGLTRQWLHAKELGFEHPITAKQIHLVSEYPADLAAVLERLRS
jgi:23S rRNA pseudouridine1911/1915/1917 synthase